MRIAVIGAGISGLTAALRLAERHAVTLFEAADYVGGHTHTHDVELAGQRLAVDSGFIVFNHRTYPNFTALLAELGVASQPTDMSFSVRCDRTRLEYAGTGLGGLFAQRGNLANPRFWRLLADWFRFNREALRRLPELDERLSVGDFFADSRYSEVFQQAYFCPLGSAVWSSPREAFQTFPMRLVVEFYRNHGMLELPGRLQWRVIRGGSRKYVEAILARFPGQVRTRAAVQAVRRRAGRVEVQVAGQPPEAFDHVVLACHSDQALRLLGPEATPLERELLSAFPYQPNRAVLHTDASVMPRCRRAWASWNYHVPADDTGQATVTYDMTRLQRLPVDSPRLLVTLNPVEPIDPRCVLREMVYHHPVFHAGRYTAQRRHRELIDYRGISYCGAYWGHGFHEDGVNSGLAVARGLGDPRRPTERRPERTGPSRASAAVG